jgi:uncharacterized membrane protein YkgB
MPDVVGLVGGLLATVVAVATLSALLPWLRNTTAPGIFCLQASTFWRAHKLLLIAGVLFGRPSVLGRTYAGQSAAASQSGNEP